MICYYTGILLHINGNGVAVDADADVEDDTIAKPPPIEGLKYKEGYEGFLDSYRSLIKNKKEEEIKTIISKINTGNFNVMTYSEICEIWWLMIFL